MRKAFFSFFSVTYLLLILSASFGSLYLETSKKSVEVDWNTCEDVPGDTEEPVVEDSREFDENILLDFSYGVRVKNPSSNKKPSAYLHSTGFHFPEIDSPPPQI